MVDGKQHQNKFYHAWSLSRPSFQNQLVIQSQRYRCRKSDTSRASARCGSRYLDNVIRFQRFRISTLVASDMLDRQHRLRLRAS